MNKYLAVCVLFIQPIVVVGMHITIPKTHKQSKKRKKVSRVIALKRSQPIDIAGSGEFSIETEQQPMSSAEFFSSSGSWICEQSCSPSPSDYRK